MAIIRKMQQADRNDVLAMMRVFYASPAVATNGSDEIFQKDIDACLSDSPYLEGYVFEKSGVLLGYAMLAKSFSTEYGLPCIWLEDIYLSPAARGSGIGSSFFEKLDSLYPDHLIRLEVETDNPAFRLYERCGFDLMPYAEMKKLPSDQKQSKERMP